MDYYFQKKWWSGSGGDSKKCKKLSASDILARIFEYRFNIDIDLKSVSNRYRFSGEGRCSSPEEKIFVVS